MDNSYVQQLVDQFIEHKDAVYAEWSENYLRNQFTCLGIRTPIRKQLIKEHIKVHGLPERESLKEVIFSLWNLPAREYQHAALDILQHSKKSLTPEDMEWLSPLITSKSWWETVDTLAPNIFGYLFTEYPDLVNQYADQWINDDQMWLQRTAILFQLKYKEKTNEDRLFAYIQRRSESNEFFVQKAIGWSLREYAKSNPNRVKLFVSETSLKPLSQREALKHLNK
ncbi:DNA alkylation repair protein [Bacillus sp. FJAT-45037]|uniref:DNA alkylation repair protein n=1 Tax=Bacillus sp. FJAT-45037 TaxID=2011007 RepID=UPI000C2311F9|nr:DNA alkylation repair protein [Bacillus sp. FJAT-45037]